MKVLRNLRGREYYIEPIDDDIIFSKLLEIPDDMIFDIGRNMGFENIPAKRMLLEYIIPNIARYLNINKEYNYQDILILLLEHMAKDRGIEKFKIYKLEEFLRLIRDNDKEIAMQKKMEINLRGLRRKALENITQVNIEMIDENLMKLLIENKISL